MVGASGSFRVGQPCQARFRAQDPDVDGRSAKWFNGVIASEPDASGACDVQYDDGDFELSVPANYLRGHRAVVPEAAAIQPSTWQVGQLCEAKYAAQYGAKAGWFAGTIVLAHPSGACDVRYNDGDVERSVPFKFIRESPAAPTPEAGPTQQGFATKSSARFFGSGDAQRDWGGDAPNDGNAGEGEPESRGGLNMCVDCGEQFSNGSALGGHRRLGCRAQRDSQRLEAQGCAQPKHPPADKADKGREKTGKDKPKASVTAARHTAGTSSGMTRAARLSKRTSSSTNETSGKRGRGVMEGGGEEDEDEEDVDGMMIIASSSSRPHGAATNSPPNVCEDPPVRMGRRLPVVDGDGGQCEKRFDCTRGYRHCGRGGKCSTKHYYAAMARAEGGGAQDDGEEEVGLSEDGSPECTPCDERQPRSYICGKCGKQCGNGGALSRHVSACPGL